MTNPEFIGLTSDQADRMVAGIKKIESLPQVQGGLDRIGPLSAYSKLKGVLVSDMVYNLSNATSTWASTFNVWAPVYSGSVNPINTSSTETQITAVPALACWPWGWPNKTKLTAGSYVICDNINGRWYVTWASNCLVPVP